MGCVIKTAGLVVADTPVLLFLALPAFGTSEEAGFPAAYLYIAAGIRSRRPAKVA